MWGLALCSVHFELTYIPEWVWLRQTAQWVGHILNRLQLTDRNRRKAYTGGQMYLIRRGEIADMMRRYDVEIVSSLHD